MRNAGLLEFDINENTDYFHEGEGVEGRIRVSNQWSSLQAALEINLADLANLQPRVSMVVRPHFGAPNRTKVTNDIFVLMPFASDLKPIYDDHIASVCRSLSLTFARSDDLFSTRSVMHDIWDSVCAARMLIADCTGRNPNVFYEIGLAHALGKPVILTTQDASDVPFDVGYLRYIEYEYTPRGMIEFEQNLKSTISHILSLDEAG